MRLKGNENGWFCYGNIGYGLYYSGDGSCLVGV